MAREVLDKEAQAILQLKEKIGSDFMKAVDLLLSCEGKVIVTGIGKSGLICQKIASTFASTGTPAFFLHPAEGVHGDLGALAKKDVVLAISNSGKTKEILNLLPILQRMGLPLIAMTGDRNSPLGKASDVVLDIGMPEEACPLGLAPTSSTTATLALGDALAVTLLEKRGFKQEDFAAFHPGGILGRKLLQVENLMHSGSEIPLIREETPMKKALLQMTGKRLGIVGVLDSTGKLQGIVTDGDLRRALEKYPNLLEKTVNDVMTRFPKVIDKTALAARALRCMEKNKITCLFVVDESNKRIPVGVIHMHDILKAEIS